MTVEARLRLSNIGAFLPSWAVCLSVVVWRLFSRSRVFCG